MQSIDTPKMSWSFGANRSLEWLQFGDQEAKHILLSFIRNLETQSVEIRIHPFSGREPNKVPPYFAPFAFESGEGDDTIAVDGVGFIQLFADGQNGFTTGNQLGRNLEIFKPVLDSIEGEFVIWVDGIEMKFPIDSDHKIKLQEIFR